MNLLIVDDHALFRGGMELLLARDEMLAGLRISQAGCLAEAFEALERAPVIDMVLLDLTLPDSDGMKGLVRLREQYPDIPVVVLSADDRVETVVSALDHGAAGFIPKSSQPAVMGAALSLIAVGGVYLPPCVLVNGIPDGEYRPAPVCAATDLAGDLGLSPRQVDVLRLLVEGKPNKLICRHLSLSEPTVKTHLSALYRKLNVNTRTQAVVRAAQLGLRLRP